MQLAEQQKKLETDNSHSYNTVSRIGERALWGADITVESLGVNDPLTHLAQYARDGEAAIASIDEDFITDCAERLVKPTFWNTVDLTYEEGDFISRINRFSMRAVTSVTTDKFRGVNRQEYERALIEQAEVERVASWFPNALTGDIFVAESMPLGSTERYSIVRLYEKQGDVELREHVITLHNSELDIFNQLHSEIGADIPPSNTSLELLDNMYIFSPTENEAPQQFIERYIDTYDQLIMLKNPGRDYRFGLERTQSDRTGDDIEMVRALSSLRSIYLNSIKVLAQSEGLVNEELVSLNERLRFGMDLAMGQRITLEQARAILTKCVQYVAATLNRASVVELRQLAETNNSSQAIDSASHHGSEASAAGITYDGACPSGSGAAADAEAAAIGSANRGKVDPTKCVNCPGCRKTVDLPKDLYRQKILHCVECKLTYKDGKRIDYRDLQKPKLNFLESLVMTSRSRALEYQIKDLDLQIKKTEEQVDGQPLIIEKEVLLREKTEIDHMLALAA